MNRSLQQLAYFFADYKALAASKKLRMFYLWLSRSGVGLLLYRIERMSYLLIGDMYSLLRIPLVPFLYVLYAYSNLEISYKAAIGPGIRVLHPSLGVVVSGYVTIGKNLILTGGNTIGRKGGIWKKILL